MNKIELWNKCIRMGLYDYMNRRMSKNELLELYNYALPIYGYLSKQVDKKIENGEIVIPKL